MQSHNASIVKSGTVAGIMRSQHVYRSKRCAFAGGCNRTSYAFASCIPSHEVYMRRRHVFARAVPLPEPCLRESYAFARSDVFARVMRSNELCLHKGDELARGLPSQGPRLRKRHPILKTKNVCIRKWRCLRRSYVVARRTPAQSCCVHKRCAFGTRAH